MSNVLQYLAQFCQHIITSSKFPHRIASTSSQSWEIEAENV